MKAKVEELLPIGSIVRLKGATKSIMIFGVGQTDMATDIEYDYIGVLYPEGNLGENSQMFFDHELIETVYFRGYEDEERTEFIAKLGEFYASQVN